MAMPGLGQGSNSTVQIARDATQTAAQPYWSCTWPETVLDVTRFHCPAAPSSSAVLAAQRECASAWSASGQHDQGYASVAQNGRYGPDARPSPFPQSGDY